MNVWGRLTNRIIDHLQSMTDLKENFGKFSGYNWIIMSPIVILPK